VESRQFFDTIDAGVPKRFDVHLVLDNYGTHKTPMIHRWLVKRPRFHLHFTPTGTSWINQVERWFALLTEKRLRRSAFRSTRELEAAIRQYIRDHNEQPRPFHWTKTADQILASVARFCTRTSETGRLAFWGRRHTYEDWLREVTAPTGPCNFQCIVSAELVRDARVHRWVGSAHVHLLSTKITTP
jgi:transposase